MKYLDEFEKDILQSVELSDFLKNDYYLGLNIWFSKLVMKILN